MASRARVASFATLRTAAAPGRGAPKTVSARNAARPNTRVLPVTHARQAAHAPERWQLADSWVAAAQSWVQFLTSQALTRTWPVRARAWRPAALRHRPAAAWVGAEKPRSNAARFRQHQPDNWPWQTPHRSRRYSGNAGSSRWRAEAHARCDGSRRMCLRISAPGSCQHRYCPEHRPPRSARLQRGRPPSMTSAAAQLILLTPTRLDSKSAQLKVSPSISYSLDPSRPTLFYPVPACPA